MSGPTAFKNDVNPLTWNVPIVDGGGRPTIEFQNKWSQQAAANATIPDLTTAAKVSGVLDLIASTPGSLLARGASQWAGLAPSAAGKILKDNGAGAVPSWATLSSVVDLIGNTRGSVLYRGAAGWAALPPSGTGKVLTDGGPGSDPAWQTPSSGGGAASIQDDGTTLYVALSDADGQLVLDGSGDPIFVPEVLPASAVPAFTQPTFTYLTATGTSTYNPPAGCVRIEVEMQAGGGGAGPQGGGGTGGTDGSDVSFNGITGVGGKKATTAGIGTPGDGGTGGVGSTGVTRRIPGEPGSVASLMIWTATNDIIVGGRGGGRSGKNVSGGTGGNGPAPFANTGAGGTGANTTNDTQANLAALTWSAGGGEGEKVFLTINSPVGPIAYTVPTGGTGFTGTSFKGGDGASGYILIKEIYK